MTHRASSLAGKRQLDFDLVERRKIPRNKVSFALGVFDGRSNTMILLSSVSRLFLGINMPDNIVGQPNDLVASSLGHFGESLCLGLVLKRIAREIYA